MFGFVHIGAAPWTSWSLAREVASTDQVETLIYAAASAIIVENVNVPSSGIVSGTGLLSGFGIAPTMTCSLLMLCQDPHKQEFLRGHDAEAFATKLRSALGWLGFSRLLCVLSAAVHSSRSTQN